MKGEWGRGDRGTKSSLATGGKLSGIASGGDISAESLKMGSNLPGKERTA